MSAEVSPYDVGVRALIVIVGNEAVAQTLAPHFLVLAAGVYGGYLGMRMLSPTYKNKKRTRLSASGYIGACALIAWLFTSAVLQLIRAALPDLKFEDKLMIGPVAFLIAFVGPNWRSVITALLASVSSFADKLKGAKK